jgi:hypothetical protein
LEKQYTVANLSSGNLLLKIITRESHLDTNAMTVSIRNKLSSLDTYILTIGCNITCFNGYVWLLSDSLAARGKTTQDLLTNLFKGYQAVNVMSNFAAFKSAMIWFVSSKSGPARIESSVYKAYIVLPL